MTTLARLRHPSVIVTAFAILAVALLILISRPALATAGGWRDTLPPDSVTVMFPEARACATVEVARTPSERQRGLMERTSLEDGTGMLFIFPTTTSSPFWMKNTYVPLSIAFIDTNGTIVDIQDMEPLDETSHYPAAPYRYALEVPQGWFERVGVTIGQRVELPPGITDGVR